MKQHVKTYYKLILVSVLAISGPFGIAQQSTHLGDSIFQRYLKTGELVKSIPFTEVQVGRLFNRNKRHGLIFQKIDSSRHIQELKLISFQNSQPIEKVIDRFGMGSFVDFERVDMNNDGYNDLLIGQGGNRYIARLYVFDPKNDSLVRVKGFIDYSESYRLGNSGFRYSYLARGCADAEWESKLFRIEDTKVIRYGLIYGHGCHQTEADRTISIDYQGTKKTLAMDSVLKVHGHKWDFIQHYWESVILKD